MTAAARAAAAAQERRPSYEDLKRRAEEPGFWGGRGVMDTREWYERCYFEPIEDFLFKNLKARYPDMTNNDIAVCVSTWIYNNSVDTATYEDITDRLLFEEALTDTHEKAVAAAYKRGYVTLYSFDMHGKTAGPYLGLRDDIDNYLDELVWRECIESDNVIMAEYGGGAFDELTEILKKSQERDDRRYSSGLS